VELDPGSTPALAYQRIPAARRFFHYPFEKSLIDLFTPPEPQAVRWNLPVGSSLYPVLKMKEFRTEPCELAARHRARFGDRAMSATSVQEFADSLVKAGVLGHGQHFDVPAAILDGIGVSR